jgi:indole-3-glycerol phosphate synthase
MNFLEKIVAEKHKEVKYRRESTGVKDLSKMDLFNRDTISFSESIKNGSGIIAEFKRMSPSAGGFNLDGKLEDTLNFYQSNGVSAYSILTDKEKFGGDLIDLTLARNLVTGPVIRKDFIVDEYQIFEAKAYGADAILLIADALDEFHCENLAVVAKSLGLEVLMEFHSKEELNKINNNVDVIGINNRNLKTMKTDVKTSIDLIKYLPFDRLKISESGISNPQQIKELIDVGYDGFLMGEYLLKSKTDDGLKDIVKMANQAKSELVS